MMMAFVYRKAEGVFTLKHLQRSKRHTNRTNYYKLLRNYTHEVQKKKKLCLSSEEPHVRYSYVYSGVMFKKIVYN